MKVSAAGNTEVPAYLVLKDIATDIEVVNNEDQTQTWKVKVNGIFRDQPLGSSWFSKDV